MTDSKFTFTSLSGSFEFTVEQDEQDPEPPLETCKRAGSDLITRGVLPGDAVITNFAASFPAAGMVRCSVDWSSATASKWLNGG